MSNLDATQTPVNPNPQNTDGYAKLPQCLAENLLALLAFNPEYGRLVVGYIEPHLFENEAYRTLATRMRDYWRQHDKPPGKAHVGDLVADILQSPRNPHAAAYRTAITGMAVLTDAGINTNYVMEQLETFMRLQSFKHAILQSAEMIESRQHLALPDVEQLFSKLLRGQHSTSPRLCRAGDLDQLKSYLARRKEHEFPTGIPLLDSRGVAPARGKLMVLLGQSGAGKSWWLIDIGRRAFWARKRVLYVTLELSKDAYLSRFHQNLAAWAWREEAKTTSVTRLRLQDDKLVGFRREPVSVEVSLQDPDIANKLDQRNANQIGFLNRVAFEEFGMRSLTVAQLRAVLDRLELTDNFIPDLMTVDYIGVLKTSSDNHRIELGHAVEELRALAVEKNIAIVTAQQVNRQGQSVKELTRDHIAEDYSPINTADFVLILQRNPREKQYKLARIRVDKARDAPDGFNLIVSQNYDHGQFVLQSAARPDRYLDLIDELPELNQPQPNSAR